MGRDLLKIDVFRKTFHRCAEILKPYDIDLYKIINTDEISIFDDIANTFTSICAIELALTDLLASIGIYPDGIAGHSVGEVGKVSGKKKF